MHEKQEDYTSFGEMGHHALAGRKHLPISLSNGRGAMAQRGKSVEERGMWVA